MALVSDLIQTLVPSPGPPGDQLGPIVSDFALEVFVPNPGPPGVPTLMGDFVLGVLGIGPPDI